MQNLVQYQIATKRIITKIGITVAIMVAATISPAVFPDNNEEFEFGDLFVVESFSLVVVDELVIAVVFVVVDVVVLDAVVLDVI